MQNTPPKPASRRQIPFLPLFRWFFTWRVLRRFVAGFAVLATLIALFYAEEDWRGKRAWEKYRHEAESSGAVLDWSAYIPPPVPDDQNIFKAPRMTEWFVGRGANDLSQRMGWGSDTNGPHLVFQDGRIKVAVLTVVPPGTPTGNADLVLHQADSNNTNLVAKCLRDAVGPARQGAAGIIIVSKPLDQIKPARIFLEADKTPDPAALLAWFPERVIPLSPIAGAHKSGRLEIESTGGNSFLVSFSAASANCCAAADYLDWSDRFEPDFATIREALKRPYARMDGDYEHYFAIPVPNFVLVRIVAQMLSQRAQADFLLGHPEKALAELTLLHNLSRLLEAKPTGKPMTLVAAMINVAITGLYAQTVADGFQLQAWREPQLVQLQAQLGEVNLAPLLAKNFHAEQAGFTHMLDTASPTMIAATGVRGTRDNLWQRLKDPWLRFWTLAPRGWIYQNMITFAQMQEKWKASADMADGQIYPRKLDGMVAEISTKIAAASPYSFLALRALPNFTAALRSMAYQQTRVNEALIACALERYHLANAQYPETLAALMPQYLDKIPADLIGGQPLKYRRTDDGRYVLYSVGWNEKDDGGTVVPNTGNNYSPAADQGDWVWPQPRQSSAADNPPLACSTFRVLNG